MKPFISVIVATKNSGFLIESVISSFKNQSFKDTELIIVDSDSDDLTKQILKKNSKDISKYISEPDSGICDAWNKGVRLSKGEWILFFGDNDVFFNNKVLKQFSTKLKSLKDNTLIVYGKVDIVGNGKTIATHGEEWEIIKNDFYSFMNIPHQGVFHRKSLFDIHGFFDEKYKFAGEYDMCIKAFKTSSPVFVPGLTVCKMMYGGQSSQASHSWNVLQEFKEIRKNNGLKAYTLNWFWNFIKSIIKLIISKFIGNENTYEIIFKIKKNYKIFFSEYK